MLPLTESEIRKQLPTPTPGIYKLLNKKGDVKRVGMDASDLAGALVKAIHPKYDFFDFKAAPSDKAAWNQLCEAWHFHRKHDFLESEDHPEPPRGKYWTCALCEEARRY